MNRTLGLTLLSAAIVLGASPARAEDTSDLQSILSEHVITTASTAAQKDSAAPALTTTITSEDLKLYGIRTIAEAVNFLSMGVFTTDPLRTPDIGARGVLFENDDGKHFLLLINGHAVNDPLNGAAHFDQGAGIPIDLVDHIEVMMGPGSVLYGSNAMMGVINVITKTGSTYRGGHVLGEYEFDHSFHVAAGTGFTFKLFGAPSEITFGIDYYKQSGPDVRFPETVEVSDRYGLKIAFGPGEPAPNVWGGTVRNSYYAEAPSAMLRFRSGDFEVNLIGSAYRRGIPYATPDQPADFDDPRSRDIDRSLRLDIKHEATLSALVSLTSHVYADTYDRQRYLVVPGQLCLQSERCLYYDAGESKWFGVEERLSLNWLHDLSLVTLLGVDVRERWATAKEDLSSAATGEYIAPTSGHIDVNSLLVAPYLQQTWTPASWVDLNAGVRLDADSRFSPVLSPRGAAAFHPWHNGTIKAIYSQAFRAPTWAETVLANHLVAPSSGATPEKVRSLEGSVEQRFGAQRLILSTFWSHWDRIIRSASLSAEDRLALQNEGRLPTLIANIQQFGNAGSIENYGFSAGWDGSLGENHFRYGTSVTETYTRLHDPSGGQELTVAPRIIGNAHLAYVPGGYFPTPALSASLLGPRPFDRVPPGGGSFPEASALADLRLTVTGALPLKGLSYRVSGEYLTASRSAYGAGPDVTWLVASSAAGPAVPVPIDQFRAFIGLRYDFLTGESEQP